MYTGKVGRIYFTYTVIHSFIQSIKKYITEEVYSTLEWDSREREKQMTIQICKNKTNMMKIFRHRSKKKQKKRIISKCLLYSLHTVHGTNQWCLISPY